ncbi:hypothetical protein M427DRAFT_71768 [Gonapodya prolifera JEL478]|uniref:SH3 domain-containing protein n=1 Tax=Gonapodya prolifera (strain JEL478) TaxID=1344416 RepID=A0A139A7P7_GONPJ|nr:hypothetical protein M427DRAFT_71768 [Gonapodya prolifera JEL478]|eukprot:KXS12826.1 hypothetical protein M427DRAFT_71768 [Gonapodya prolifera JEL478]
MEVERCSRNADCPFRYRCRNGLCEVDPSIAQAASTETASVGFGSFGTPCIDSLEGCSGDLTCSSRGICDCPVGKQLEQGSVYACTMAASMTSTRVQESARPTISFNPPVATVTHSQALGTEPRDSQESKSTSFPTDLTSDRAPAGISMSTSSIDSTPMSVSNNGPNSSNVDGSSSSSTPPFIIPLASSLAAVVFLAVAMALFAWRRRRKMTTKDPSVRDSGVSMGPSEGVESGTALRTGSSPALVAVEAPSPQMSASAREPFLPAPEVKTSLVPPSVPPPSPSPHPLGSWPRIGQQSATRERGVEHVPYSGPPVLVVAKHVPHSRYEVALWPGQYVDLKEIYRDGWALGFNLENGGFGAIPLGVLQLDSGLPPIALPAGWSSSPTLRPMSPAPIPENASPAPSPDSCPPTRASATVDSAHVLTGPLVSGSLSRKTHGSTRSGEVAKVKPSPPTGFLRRNPTGVSEISVGHPASIDSMEVVGQRNVEAHSLHQAELVSSPRRSTEIVIDHD